MLKNTLLVIMLLGHVALCSQVNILWQKSLDISVGKEEDANSIKQTADNGYIIIGEVFDYLDNQFSGYDDVIVVKTDETGEVEWYNVLGSSRGDKGIDISQSSDGGYFLACQPGTKDGDVPNVQGKKYGL